MFTIIFLITTYGFLSNNNCLSFKTICCESFSDNICGECVGIIDHYCYYFLIDCDLFFGVLLSNIMIK